MKPRKHAELIKAWADGATIERLWTDPHDRTQAWLIDEEPDWNVFEDYRIKPGTQTVTMYIYNNTKDGRTWMDVYPNEILYPEWQYMGSIEVTK